MDDDIGARLKALREKKGLSLRALGKFAHVSHSFIANIEAGRSKPSLDTLLALARALGASVADITGEISHKDSLGLSDSGRAETRAADDSLPPNAIPVSKLVRVPVLGVIRAGEPIYAEQHIEDWIDVPAEDVKGRECFFLRVTGDSMEGAGLVEGDLVFVYRQDVAQDGDIVVVIVNGEDATIKRVFFPPDAIILQPENPKYRPMIFKGKERQEVKIVGKAVWFKRSLR